MSALRQLLLRSDSLRSIIEEQGMPSLVGNPAVPFELTDIDRTKHRLADYVGKWLLLVFHRHLG
jgi:hypothetical protein